MTKNEFAKQMLLMGEIFNIKVSKERIDVYYTIFENSPDKQLKKAFNYIIETFKFFPKPVEIIEVIEEIYRKDYMQREAELNKKQQDEWLEYCKIQKEKGE